LSAFSAALFHADSLWGGARLNRLTTCPSFVV
jgi:hypothetical protein